MLGLLEENGPLLSTVDGSVAPNPYSWDKLVDYIWIDQPVYVLYPVVVCRYSFTSHVFRSSFSGVGFATADSTGYGESKDTRSVLVHKQLLT
jgi:hypothetical protein